MDEQNRSLMQAKLNATLSKTQPVTDVFSKRQTHEGCGECCTCFLPLSRAERIRLRRLARTSAIHDVPPNTIDITCPFLVENNCSIYEKRPDICRVFDCSKHVKGDAGYFIEIAKIAQNAETTNLWDMVNDVRRRTRKDGQSHA